MSPSTAPASSNFSFPGRAGGACMLASSSLSRRVQFPLASPLIPLARFLLRSSSSSGCMQHAGLPSAAACPVNSSPMRSFSSTTCLQLAPRPPPPRGFPAVACTVSRLVRSPPRPGWCCLQKLYPHPRPSGSPPIWVCRLHAAAQAGASQAGQLGWLGGEGGGGRRKEGGPAPRWTGLGVVPFSATPWGGSVSALAARSRGCSPPAPGPQPLPAQPCCLLLSPRFPWRCCGTARSQSPNTPDTNPTRPRTALSLSSSELLVY
ncbi:uncharacterized protein LOC127549038 [Antechinus flavipes]|uniref:uncharacterized protein LOC127549038 n=1 Tax=Antechinus flavipes TaxID=38775 RepID=UPI0022358AAC|nr:uncharacterized protein LOC127549038 [Antechinus flavipes]